MVNQGLTGEVKTEDEVLIMMLSQVYKEREQEIKRQGMEQGQVVLVENLFRSRFGELDEQLLAVIPLLLALPTEEYCALLLRLSNFSREELLANF